MPNKRTQIGWSAIALMLLSVVTYSQTRMLRGRVVMKQDNGMKVAVEAATVDAFRTDLPGNYTTKTDDEGVFIFAGLPFVGTYVLAASSPNAKPNIAVNAKAGRDQEYEIVLESGHGERLTMDEALASAKASNTAALVHLGESPSEILGRAFREGNMALVRKDYDEAIRLYDEGLAASPQEPPLLVNKCLALKARGVESYNTAIGMSRDENTKEVRLVSARKDFREAAETATQAVEIIKNQKIREDEDDRRIQLRNKYAALTARAEAMRLFVTFVDPSQVAVGLAAFQECVAVEEDPFKRSRLELDAARMLLDSKNTNLAVEQYRGILIRDPNDMDALAGLGLALYQLGDKSRFLEASGYLQRFMDQAPETHAARPAVAEILKKLKSIQ
jgi:tetratricopeptide (TPR) repeat protein